MQVQSAASHLMKMKQNKQSKVRFEPMPLTTATTTVADSTATTATIATLSHHPILGATQVDLGYKHIHLVSSKDLSDIPVWENQCIY